jgi:hypothetical protein
MNHALVVQVVQTLQYLRHVDSYEILGKLAVRFAY